jgi:Uma2 family endonuclease
MEEKKVKPYESSSVKPTIVEEPLAMYGTLDLDESKRYTYADYLSWLDDRRMELINGFIHFMSAPRLIHALILSRIGNPMINHIEKNNGRCNVFYAPFDVRFPKSKDETDDKQIYDVVQPDICVVCNPEQLSEKGCLGAPNMIVEILSASTRKYDLTEKFNLYEASGVKEYWVVAPKEDVTVYLLQDGGKYDKGTVYGEYEQDVEIPVRTLSGLNINLKKLFAAY